MVVVDIHLTPTLEIDEANSFSFNTFENVSTSANTITIPDNPFVNGSRFTYDWGMSGSANIGLE